MESRLEVEMGTVEKDYYPALFANKDHTVIILADQRTDQQTFSGMIIHSHGNTKKALLGTYSTSWTYTQFKRLPRTTVIDLTLTQDY